ncbi:MAG: glycosyltransferase [Sediminibacterium sp.]
MNKQKICIAPLDWGLGHATRCISLAKALVQLDYQVFIASEGHHEVILREALPEATFLPLPGYRIQYSKEAKWFLLKMIAQLPKIIFSVYYERNWLRKMQKQFKFDVILSDNRFGFYHNKVASVFITHQLNIQSGFAWTNRIINVLQYRFIKKFDALWVPDIEGEKNYAGILSNPSKKPSIPIWYMGALSRLQPSVNHTIQNKIRFLGIVSGPEPQRTLFENALWMQGNAGEDTFAIVAGRPVGNNEPTTSNKGKLYPHANGTDLADLINAAEYIIFRGGYTSLMELIPFKKKLIIIPTPGQTEQEYLANWWALNHWAICYHQEGFNLKEALANAASIHFTQPLFYPFSIETLKDKLKDLTL